MFLHMALVIKLTPLGIGGLCISPSFGGSVARAKAPRVSIIKFTQSNCTAVRGADPESWVGHKEFINFSRFQMVLHKGATSLMNTPERQAETKLITRATMLTVS